MPETVTVAAADLQALTGVFSLSVKAFGSTLGHVPGFGAAIEACARLEAAAASASLPEDPVGAGQGEAIAYNVLLNGFMEAGFDRSEAFRLVEIRAAAASQLALARALHG
jgi:hypothetical protein